MDLFEKAFGEFNPQQDKDVAIKFILNSLLMDQEPDRLIELFDLSKNVGSIECEPGWELEHVVDENREMSGYSEWPEWASYKAAVDPDSFQLSYPVAYYKTEDFMAYVQQALNAYVECYPEKKSELTHVYKYIT